MDLEWANEGARNCWMKRWMNDDINVESHEGWARARLKTTQQIIVWLDMGLMEWFRCAINGRSRWNEQMDGRIRGMDKTKPSGWID